MDCNYILEKATLSDVMTSSFQEEEVSMWFPRPSKD
jgi:hypothetical protein